MRARISTIPVASAEIGQLSALVVGADLEDGTAPVLLFLHGKGEAGSSLSALPLVCVHQTPPFQAILGRLPELSSLLRKRRLFRIGTTGIGGITQRG